MTRRVKKYLFDISYSIDAILNNYLSAVDSLEQYEEDMMLQDAVERRLIIIGEALNKLQKMDVELATADRLINRRNTLAHQYDDYNTETIWRSIHQDLPPLKIEVDSMLAS